MRKVLDKLMARQMRLMDALSEPPADKVPAPARGPAPTPGEIEAENTAVDRAMEQLAAGDMAAASMLLAPYEGAAALARTLTTLARMKTRQGEHDQALAYLQRAERLDPMDRKVWYFLAELFHLQQRHAEEADYRRRLAYAGKDVAAKAYIDLIAAIVKAAPKSGHPRLSEIKFLATKLDDVADLDDAQRVALAKALYPVGPLAELAKSHYATASPCPPGYCDTTVRMVSLIAWCKQAAAPMAHIPDAGIRGRRPVVAELSDVLVLPNLQWMPVVDSGKALLANFASNRLRLQAEDPSSPLLLQCEHRADLRLPREMPLLETPALLVGGSGNYAADVLEYLGALAVPDSLGIGKDLPIVVNDALAPRQLELLALLGYDAARLIRLPADRPVRFKHLFVPTRLAIGDQWIDPLLPRWYRARLAPNAAATPTRKLYLCLGANADAEATRNQREAETARALAPLGYEAVYPEALGMRERIDLFADASHVVAPICAALTDMVFMKPGATLALVPDGDAAGRNFEALAKACGHRLATLDLAAGEGVPFDAAALRAAAASLA